MTRTSLIGVAIRRREPSATIFEQRSSTLIATAFDDRVLPSTPAAIVQLQLTATDTDGDANQRRSAQQWR